MTPLSPITGDASWPDEILEAAKEFFNGLLTITKPGKAGAYDPVTDTYTGEGYVAPVVLISNRPARAQHISSPREANSADGWDVERRYRFQCEILTGDPSITKGLVATFSGGRDPELAKMTFQVVSATNSSHAALRTVECVTELARASA